MKSKQPHGGESNMKLGVNLFSVRKFLKNEADVRESFRKIRDIGYEVVQL